MISVGGINFSSFLNYSPFFLNFPHFFFWSFGDENFSEKNNPKKTEQQPNYRWESGNADLTDIDANLNECAKYPYYIRSWALKFYLDSLLHLKDTY